jgi:lipopolysaccharide export system ATP-binding protein
MKQQEKPVLEAKNLVKAYKGRRVVDRVSLKVDKGEIVGLLGPNGAGKTTCFRMIVGMISADEGKVFFRGKDITKLQMYKRARNGMGYLAQEPSIFRKMTVEDNILAVLEACGKYSRSVITGLLEELLAELDLTRLRHSIAETLSGGERRRLEITRGLATDPALILLDEPFAAIDPIAVQEIQSILADLKQRGISILITDHSVHETLKITDRSYVIHMGQVLKEGPPAELKASEEVRKVYLGDSFDTGPAGTGTLSEGLGGEEKDALEG